MENAALTELSVDRQPSPSAAPPCDEPLISMVVIGRNEGERLVRCLESIRAVDYPADRIELIYVDSNSTDGSCEAARRAGARVIEIRSGPLSAARARNLGWRAARGELVHFVDGDTVFDRQWLRKALERIQEPGIACVFGRCEEIRPQASIYMRVCAFDWHVPSGPWRTCGGIALFRRELLECLGGFCELMVAGEEPELCYRLRRLGLQVWRLDEPMVLHDLDMTRFSQYWRRAVRSGWAYMVVAARCFRGPERLWVRENMVNAAEVAIWVALLIASAVTRSGWILLALGLLIAARVVWIAVKSRSACTHWRTLLLYGLHCQISRIPFFIGQMKGVCFLLSRAWRQSVPVTVAGHRR